MRLIVHAEGLTEETFVNELLEPHLCGHGYARVDARLVGNARNRDRRGGIRKWQVVRREIIKHLKDDTGRLATTMIDFYALPHSGPGAWPRRADASSAPFEDKARMVEDGMLAEVCAALGEPPQRCRFVPFVMMHEFEGLLFSDCHAFGRGVGRPDLVSAFQAIRDEFSTPEEINDHPATAPSKRVEQLIPGYQKPHLGTLAIREIGLDEIRAQCPHFREWMEQLEAWPRTRRPRRGGP